jgi:Phage integrase family
MERRREHLPVEPGQPLRFGLAAQLREVTVGCEQGLVDQVQRVGLGPQRGAQPLRGHLEQVARRRGPDGAQGGSAQGGLASCPRVLHADREPPRQTEHDPGLPGDRQAGSDHPGRLRFHDLRHTHARLLLSKGQSLRAVSFRLGHSNAAMTLRVYAHCLPSDDAKLAEALSRMMA